ncbi:MAG TPA: RNA 2',3'-cyclic phosphodiesterase [Blastocatellia bacterium]|nr:RNA 2',3'-cyclic phosphodiesterase [Blastocatellia bacterium]
MTSSTELETNPGNSNSVRVFICIEIPASIKDRVAELQQGLRQHDAKISWVKPSNVHLTLRFLGDVATSHIPAVGAAVTRAARLSQAFEIEVGTAGCFPSAKRPRVFWVGLTAVPNALSKLHVLVEKELAREGFAPDDRKFSPHLTIGRVRSPQNATRVAEDLIATGFEPESFQATEVIVMRSELNPRGSIYSPLYKLSLEP